MELQQIQETLANYEILEQYAETRIEFMSEVDDEKYSTDKGIMDIAFDRDHVYVTYNSSSFGCAESEHFSFPITYLSLSDEKLRVLLLQNIEERRRKDKERIEQEEFKYREKEKAELERLKAKYETVNSESIS